jgi:hypothetical protein
VLVAIADFHSSVLLVNSSEKGTDSGNVEVLCHPNMADMNEKGVGNMLVKKTDLVVACRARRRSALRKTIYSRAPRYSADLPQSGLISTFTCTEKLVPSTFVCLTRYLNSNGQSRDTTRSPERG